MGRTESASQWTGLAAASRPLAALTAVWLTTAGHTMNFREFDAAHGWISTEGYSLHSSYLFSVALTLPIAPRAVAWLGSYLTALLGLALLAVASLASGTFLHLALVSYIGLRVVAGVGAGLVIVAAPRLINPAWDRQASWAGILFPALGPLVISWASIQYGWSNWEGGFLFEAVLALFGLSLLLTMAPPVERPGGALTSIAYWPALVVSLACRWYILHWGQLSGWLEDAGIRLAMAGLILGVLANIWLARSHLRQPHVPWLVPRLVLVGFGGFVQYFNVSDMGVYGGLLVNYSVWQRGVLLWSLSVGSALGLAVGEIFWRGRPPRLTGIFLGLVITAAGFALARQTTLSWPYWRIENTFELNWFQAPQFWQLAPARVLMGFGSALVLFSTITHSCPDPAWELRIGPRLQESQFLGGAISIGVLATAILVVHQWEYSYVADRGFIQPQELAERTEILGKTFVASGEVFAARKAQVVMNRAVNYQADNLLFADIYSGYLIASLGLALAVGGRIVMGLLKRRTT